jgi:SSS family solute:Na+ symporter
MLNSTSTILQWISTNNILIKMLMIEQTNVGRISGAVALLIAVIMAPLLGGSSGISIYTRIYWCGSPGIAVFILGLFWKKHLIRLIWAHYFLFYCNVFKVGPKSWAAEVV